MSPNDGSFDGRCPDCEGTGINRFSDPGDPDPCHACEGTGMAWKAQLPTEPKD